MTHTCLACGKEWARPPTRGQIPKWCPTCRKADRRNRPCTRCGKPTASRSQYCSRNCLARARERPRELAVYTGASTTTALPSRPARAARRFKSGQCRVCETWFVTLNMDVTCSPQCQARKRRLDKDKRRARQRDAYVSDVKRSRVFERDGYRCHLCHRRTNPSKKVPHPMAPTIDHLIPLARGGSHEPLNCRTACFRCNTSKGDRGGGEQLLLIA